MNNREIALEIVKTALQNGQFIPFRPATDKTQNNVADANEFNANQISEFYQIVYKHINNPSG